DGEKHRQPHALGEAMPSLPPPLSALSLLPCACCLMSKYQANNRGSMAWRVNRGGSSNYHSLCLEA
ncbi:hypothetical protein L195_g018292, partial [Trifolium pratense]